MSLKLVTTAHASVVSGLQVPAPVALPVETVLPPSTPNPNAAPLLSPPPTSPSEGLHPSLVPESFRPYNLLGGVRAPPSWRETTFSLSESHPGPRFPALPGSWAVAKCGVTWDRG